jgi:Glycosyl transferase family 2
MNKICVLIRVYNRIEDLRHCVNIIRDTWTQNNYYIVVAANGREDGFVIQEETIGKIDKLTEIENNIGHFSGNSQLLLAGLHYVPDDCLYTVILEADTWIYGDNLITNYIGRMQNEKAVWASAQFFRYVENLATDFAIIDTAFLMDHQDIFVFLETPEYFVSNYLAEKGYHYIYMNEIMPINLPKYIRKYPYAPTGRFFSFQKGKMVTHHIEVIKGGMKQKQHDFNMVSGTSYFPFSEKTNYGLKLLYIRIFKALTILFPYKGWLVRRKK